MCPDEEGIETEPHYWNTVDGVRQKMCPDEEGIETTSTREIGFSPP